MGKKVVINSYKNANVIGGDIRTNLLIGEDAVLNIGNNVGISNSTIVCYKEITIEDDVLIGGSCKIYDTDFHSMNPSLRSLAFVNRTKDNNAISRPVVIEKGVWIGGHCIILKGSRIGSQSIIGAGSVVSGNIPPLEIWAGNPARFIRKI